jgi:hypothetical protein
MRKFFSGTVVALNVSLIVIPAVSQAETRRALLVGIDQYISPESKESPPAVTKTSSGSTGAASAAKLPGRSGWRNLRGAVNDIEAFQKILKKYGFKDEDIRVLKNGDATREGILTAIRHHLIEPATPGDVHIFYYAGHGSQVVNSQSSELDKKDETIVPVDAKKGEDIGDSRDIRDKELRRLFNDIIDKGAVLTVFFDSCYSGSVARGLALEEEGRFLPSDPRDVARGAGAEAPDPRPAPEARGALIFSAAQDFGVAHEETDETLDNKPYGAFTLALLKVLGTVRPQESAESIFLRTKSLIRKVQEPVFAGSPGRRQKPLFGVGQATSSESAVAVRDVLNDGTVELQGGFAFGLREKCELKKLGSAVNSQLVRVRVEQVHGWSSASARVIAGKVETIQPGDLFVMDLWVTPDQPYLRVWLPPVVPLPELRRLIAEAQALRNSNRIQWIDDPTEETPTYRLEWNGSSWVLVQPEVLEEKLGKTFTAKQLLEKFPTGAKEKAKLFVRFPPFPELLGALNLNKGKERGAIETTTIRQQADYELVGRLNGKTLEYAWVFPNMTREEADQKLPHPVRTKWRMAATTPDSVKTAAGNLQEETVKIARIFSWRQLQQQAPPAEGNFPYTLMLRNVETQELIPIGIAQAVAAGKYTLVLQASEEGLKPGVTQRYVYVYAIDRDGAVNLLFPRPERGTVENYLPYKGDAGKTQKPSEIPLETITIRAPFGLDTYILLTSGDPIPNPTALEQQGVGVRGEEPKNPLARFLYGLGSETRGPVVKTPANWSVASFVLRSVPE